MVNGEQVLRKNPKIDLDGKTWIKYSISIWGEGIAKTIEEMRLKHPAMFSQKLASRLISVYTQQGGVVLDPFLGSGSSLVAAKNLGRNGVGLDVSDEYIKLAKIRLAKETLDSPKNTKHKIIKRDARKSYGNKIKKDSIDFCITSPPYWDILNQRRSADYKKIRNYGNQNNDLGNIEIYDQFLEGIKSSFSNVFKVLKKGKRCVVICMDIRKKAKFYSFHIDLTKIMEEIGFELDDIVIWDRRKDYNNFRPLGYPYVFRVNKAHEFIMIFQKP